MKPPQRQDGGRQAFGVIVDAESGAYMSRSHRTGQRRGRLFAIAGLGAVSLTLPLLATTPSWASGNPEPVRHAAQAPSVQAANLVPGDFALVDGETTVHVINNVGAGTPGSGGNLNPVDGSGTADFDLDGQAATPTGNTILEASGGGNVSVCLNVQSGTPDCNHSVSPGGIGYTDVDTVGITADGTFGIVNDGNNLARIPIDTLGNPSVGAEIPLTKLSDSVAALVIAPVATAPDRVRVLVEGDSGKIEVLNSVGITGGAGAGFTEGAVLSTTGSGASGEGRGGMIFSPADNTRALIATSAGPVLFSNLGSATPTASAPLNLGSGCTGIGDQSVSISKDGKLAVTDCGGSVAVISGIDTGTLHLDRTVPTNLSSITTLAVTLNGNAVVAGPKGGGQAVDEVIGYANAGASAIPTGKDVSIPDNAGDTMLVFPTPGFSIVLPPVKAPGYTLLGADGGVFAFNRPFVGAAKLHTTNFPGGPPWTDANGAPLSAPFVGIASTPSKRGYWAATRDGGVYSFGDASFFGSLGGQHLNAPIVGIAASPLGDGYWLVAADGGVFAFGAAPFQGSFGGQHLNAPIVGVASSRDGNGYWLFAADGGVFAFGDAAFLGSLGSLHLNAPIVGGATIPSGDGYWLAGSDGGVFAFGSVQFQGSMGGQALNAPISAMAGDGTTSGYWLFGNDGGVFAFGNAPFLGSEVGATPPLRAPIVGATN
jgi:hypothetical protein